ncbi:hypothetical protein [Paraburkholderia fungorum]|uniref:hypothetical protein n=1 Tax=Paraburkholderia fungorum TaxID=134537 RepID=UPI0038BC8A43
MHYSTPWSCSVALLKVLLCREVRNQTGAVGFPPKNSPGMLAAYGLVERQCVSKWPKQFASIVERPKFDAVDADRAPNRFTHFGNGNGIFRDHVKDLSHDSTFPTGRPLHRAQVGRGEIIDVNDRPVVATIADDRPPSSTQARVGCRS